MGSGDEYGGLQQPGGGYAGAGGANDPTSYGDVQNPSSPYEKKPVPAPVSAPVALLEQVKSDLAAIKLSLNKANLFDMSLHKNYKAFQTVKFAAWTNSAQRIYVDLDWFENTWNNVGFGKSGENWTTPQYDNNKRAATLIVVGHEIEHVKQFLTKGGHPKSFQAMIAFEFEAYTNTEAWLKDSAMMNYLIKKIGATPDLVAFLTESMASSKDTFRAGQAIKDETGAKEWLTKGEHLPKAVNENEKYGINDLYSTT